MFINCIRELDQLLDYEKEIEQGKKISISNISFWNASPEYQNYILKNILLENDANIFEYVYTYDFSEDYKKQILEKITGRVDNNSMCMLTPSSTISIVNLINSNFAHRFCLCTLKIQYLAVIQLSKFYCYAA